MGEGALLFRGRVYEYNGPREKENIVTFMKEQSKQPSEEKAHMLGITNNMDRWGNNERHKPYIK